VDFILSGTSSITSSGDFSSAYGGMNCADFANLTFLVEFEQYPQSVLQQPRGRGLELLLPVIVITLLFHNGAYDVTGAAGISTGWATQLATVQELLLENGTFYSVCD
jgi:hypothetical protein